MGEKGSGESLVSWKVLENKEENSMSERTCQTRWGSVSCSLKMMAG